MVQGEGGKMKYAGFLIVVIVLILLTPVEAIPFDVLEPKLGRPVMGSVEKIAILHGFDHRAYPYELDAWQESVELNSNVKQGMKKETSRRGDGVPTAYLLQNYPNPFNPSTTITYRLPEDSHVDLKVFSILGNEVATLVQGRRATGVHRVRFVGRDLPGGIYFCRLEYFDERGSSVIRTMRMVLTR
ncbi:MAG: T9SS type A sorting domain-containing protein [Ignavibacteriales bacterium]|nr:T9SS type A sorting domain-containing protein [Ignavibacteriales bacterium]